MRFDRLRTAAVLLACAASLAACGGDGGGGGTQPTPGTLTVRLTTPAADDRAIMLSVTGAGIASPQPAGNGHVLHHRASGNTLKAAVFGTLASGALLRFQVPDIHQAAAYTATVLDVAGPDNQLRSTAAYTLTVER